MKSPIFIFSLPRSGSTLLQRVLMTDSEICSVAEPWVLLPQIYMLKKQGTISEFSSLTAYQAITDFIKNLPNKDIDYNDSLRAFILDLYSKQCKNGERYFLDKTPRYYLIIDEIIALFPDAKFIFLFRNPLHVYASIIDTWGNKRLNKIHRNNRDLIKGFSALSDGYKKHEDISICIKYEEFVSNPEKELDKISRYLNLKLETSSLINFSKQNTKGELGDPTGTKFYTNISKEGLYKWKRTLNSIYRKKLVLNVFKHIDTEDFEIQGFNKHELILDLKSIDNKNNKLFLIDVVDFFKSYLIATFKLNLLFIKDYKWFKNRFIS
ncbi:sulfotransferase family protein [Hanstruepera marina]|uniref:sulfotransferase family protein n=1 Tax=Hanstruepera marina TaxID=2873265 RepID=UPI001CA619D1|nr:sulfotransferase [Hanstruepera marina]